MFNSNDKIQEFKNILDKQKEMSSVNLMGTTYTVIPTEIEITPVTNKYKVILTIVLAVLCLFIGINIATSIMQDSKTKVLVDYNENADESLTISSSDTYLENDNNYEYSYVLNGEVNIKKQYSIS